MVNKDVLDEFAQLVMKRVRDESVWRADAIISGRLKGEKAELIREKMGSLTTDTLKSMSVLIPEIIDSTLFYLFNMLDDEDDLKLYFTSRNGITIVLNEASDGLAGELFNKDGWINRFSTERSFEVE